jgi:hypothetical protein
MRRRKTRLEKDIEKNQEASPDEASPARDYGSIDRADNFYGKKNKATRLPTGSKRLKAKKTKLAKI